MISMKYIYMYNLYRYMISFVSVPSFSSQAAG